MRGNIIVDGVYGKTQQVTVTDAVQLMSDVVTFGDNPPIGLIITSEDNPTRYAFRVDPSATFGHVLAKDQTLRLYDGFAAKNMRIINDTAQSAAVLMVTPIYEIGKYSE